MPGTQSIVGLQSGIDTTQIVDAMIQFERRNAVLLEQRQAETTNIVSVLKALQAKFLALNTTITSLKKTSTFEAATVSVSDETYLKATTTGRVGFGSYDIQVLSLARNHQLASQGFSDQSLADFGVGTISISIGDGAAETITIDTTNNSLVGIKSAINNAKVGVTASIINDGSISNPYRLILTSDSTGLANEINITSSLSGGLNLDYSTVSFDDPERTAMAAGSTSEISLGTSASYTGSQNKTYTFTVAGTGEQTVGVDVPITINWTDGTNSGSIDVVDTSEVQLTGAGADGLYLAFSAGTLNAGDQFQVSTFAPLLQEAADARIAFGSSSGSGSPLTVSSETNEFKNVIGGLTLTAQKETEAGEVITINTDVDISTIKDKINTFITRYNEIMGFINDQNTYDQDSGSSGVLFGDVTLWSMQNSLHSVLTAKIDGIDTKFCQLYSIGIRTTGNGTLAIVDNSRFEDALQDNLDDVIKLFTDSGNSSSNYIEFVSAGSMTKAGQEFKVDISVAATRGIFRGSSLTDPGTTALTLDSTNNIIQLVVDGVTSEGMALTEKTYSSSNELVAEIQARIDADDNIGNRGLTVEWVDIGGGSGYLEFTSAAYGSKSKVEIYSSVANSAYAKLALAAGSSISGDDVEGTINGEPAEGNGQYLTGKEGNLNTEGLKLKITLNQSDTGTGAEGTITLSRGAASRLGDLVSSLTMSGDGTFDRRIRGYENQVQHLRERIEEIDERLEIRRESLLKQFWEMEEKLSELNAQGQFLTNQLAAINTNWGMLSSRRYG